MSDNKKAQQTTPRNYLINSEQLMDVMRYLMSRPYGEVVKLMTSLSSLSPLDSKINPDFVKGESDGRKK